MESQLNDTGRNTEAPREKSVLTLLHPLQIPCKLACDLSWASVDYKKTPSVISKQTAVILFNKLLQIYLFLLLF